MNDLWTTLIDVSPTISMAISLLVGQAITCQAFRLHQMIRITCSGIGIEELLASGLQSRPTTLVVVAIPNQMLFFSLALTIIIRFVIIIQRRSGKLKHLDFQSHRRTFGPTTSLSICLRTCISKRQFRSLDGFIEQADDKINRFLHGTAWESIFCLITCVLLLDDWQTTIETEHVVIALRHQALCLCHQAIALGLLHLGTTVDIIHQDITITQGLPQLLILISITGTARCRRKAARIKMLVHLTTLVMQLPAV